VPCCGAFASDKISLRMAANEEQIRDVAHLAHVEVLTPRLDESLTYFRDVLGMEETGREGDSIYLRGYGDYERATLKLTASADAGVGHVAFRTMSARALERRVAAIETSGLGLGWIQGDIGHGRAYRFTDPDGHVLELYFESERFEPPPELRPALRNQPQRFTARGASVKRLDHVNFLAVEPSENRAFLEDYLGFRLTEAIVLDDGSQAGVWLTANQKSYEVTYTHDATGTRGRLHHVAYAVDQREDVLRAADVCLENDVFIETGPHKHAIQQTFFLYTWEPAGNRIEVCAGGYLILAPDWEPVLWTQAERAKGQAWGLQTVESFHTYGTPVVSEQ
jgi:catechol 2,3-dioxygenase